MQKYKEFFKAIVIHFDVQTVHSMNMLNEMVYHCKVVTKSLNLKFIAHMKRRSEYVCVFRSRLNLLNKCVYVVHMSLY